SNPDWPNFAPGALTTHYPPLPELTAALARAGFGKMQCSGILPITTSTPHQRLVNSARRWLIRSGMLPFLGPVKRTLQALSYGKLHPLPRIVDPAWIAQWQAGVTSTLLPHTQPDRIHRVLYVEASK